MQEYLIIIISAVLINNIVLSQFLGICPFLGVSKKLSASLGMGGRSLSSWGEGLVAENKPALRIFHERRRQATAAQTQAG